MDTNNPETKPNRTQPEAEELALQDNEARIRKWSYSKPSNATEIERKLEPTGRDTFLDDLVEVNFIGPAYPVSTPQQPPDKSE